MGWSWFRCRFVRCWWAGGAELSESVRELSAQLLVVLGELAVALLGDL